MGNPKISIIVPIYKVDRFLNKCIDSIINQKLREIEIILIDENDMDRCREIIDYYQRIDSRIIAPHEKRGGYGASVNHGINIASGEYILIVESDDFIEREMCHNLYLLAKGFDADVVKGPYSEYLGSENKKIDCRYRQYISDSLPTKKPFNIKEFGELLEVHASIWAAIYKRKFLLENKIYFIEEKGGGYVDVGFRIKSLVYANRIIWDDIPYYNYRIDSPDSTTNNINLGLLIKRWGEVHREFENNYDFNNYFYPHLAIDEYLNTFGWLHEITYSLNDVKMISDNLRLVTEESIRKSKVLSKYQKAEMILCRKDYMKYYKRLALYNKLRFIKDKYHNINFNNLRNRLKNKLSQSIKNKIWNITN